MMKNKKVREPIATWWRVSRFSVEIEPVQVVAFTASFVTYLEKGWRYDGPDAFTECRSQRADFFPTWEEAKAEEIRRTIMSVEATKERLQKLRTRLGQLESLKPPTPASLKG